MAFSPLITGGGKIDDVYTLLNQIDEKLTLLTDEIEKTSTLELIASNSGTSYKSFNFSKEKYKYFILSVYANPARALASIIIHKEDIPKCNTTGSNAECSYAGEPSNYKASVYFVDDVLYIKSNSAYDTARLYGVL